MNLNEFAQEVHANAVAHGWWKVEIPTGNFEFASGRTAQSNSEGLGLSAAEEYTDAAVIALIHSEISEAFEEWRAGRPAKWYKCMVDGDPCKGSDNCAYKQYCANSDDFVARVSPKPEGIAVELIDVVLCLLDAAAAWGVSLVQYHFKQVITMPGLKLKDVKALTLPELVCDLHNQTVIIYDRRVNSTLSALADQLSYTLSLVFQWLNVNYIDPEALMLEKHNYNKTRPYKHGGKRV